MTHSVVPKATAPINETAFEQAFERFRAVYREEYSAAARTAIDDDDRREAHDEATSEALYAAIVAYRERAR